MIKTGYKVTQEFKTLPEILVTSVDDPECLSWREAKKQLRSFYLEQASKLRAVKESDYFR